MRLDCLLHGVSKLRNIVRLNKCSVNSVFNLHFGASTTRGNHIFTQCLCFGNIQPKDFEIDGWMNHYVETGNEGVYLLRGDFSVPYNSAVVPIFVHQIFLVLFLVLPRCATNQMKFNISISQLGESVKQDVDAFYSADSSNIIEPFDGIVVCCIAGSKVGKRNPMRNDLDLPFVSTIENQAFCDGS